MANLLVFDGGLAGNCMSELVSDSGGKVEEREDSEDLGEIVAGADGGDKEGTDEKLENAGCSVSPVGIVFRSHALQRMFERGIVQEDICEVLFRGRVIESYPDATPFPKCLWLGMDRYGRALHVVAADSEAECKKIIITAYYPDSELWLPGWTMRRR